MDNSWNLPDRILNSFSISFYSYNSINSITSLIYNLALFKFYTSHWRLYRQLLQKQSIRI